MKSRVSGLIGKAAGQRIAHGQAGVFPAIAAAVITGVTTAVITYRVLRSGG